MNMVKRSSREECCTWPTVTRKIDAVHSECAFPVGAMLYMVVPDLVERNAVHGKQQSIYRGRGEIGRVYLPLSWRVPYTTNFVHDVG
jgi:hypothetical protein